MHSRRARSCSEGSTLPPLHWCIYSNGSAFSTILIQVGEALAWQWLAPRVDALGPLFTLRCFHSTGNTRCFECYKLFRVDDMRRRSAHRRTVMLQNLGCLAAKCSPKTASYAQHFETFLYNALLVYTLWSADSCICANPCNPAQATLPDCTTVRNQTA